MAIKAVDFKINANSYEMNFDYFLIIANHFKDWRNMIIAEKEKSVNLIKGGLYNEPEIEKFGLNFFKKLKYEELMYIGQDELLYIFKLHKNGKAEYLGLVIPMENYKSWGENK